MEGKGLGVVNPLIPGMGNRQGWNRIGSWKTRRSLQDRWMGSGLDCAMGSCRGRKLTSYEDREGS